MPKLQQLYLIVIKCYQFGAINPWSKFGAPSKNFNSPNFKITRLVTIMNTNMDLKKEVLAIKAAVKRMRAAFDEIENRTESLLMAIEGTPSGRGEYFPQNSNQVHY